MHSRPWSEPALRPQLLLTGVMVLLAAVACHLMLVQMHFAGASSILAALALVLATVFVRLRLGADGRVGDVLIVASFALALLPLPLAGVAAQAGMPFRVLVGLRNVGLVALVFASQPRTMRMAAQASMALILFSFSLGNGWVLLVVAILFAGVGVAWMVMASWREFAERIPEAAARAAPWSWALLLGLMGGACFLAGVLLYPTEAQGLLQQYINLESADEAAEKARALAQQAMNQEELGEMAAEKYGLGAITGTELDQQALRGAAKQRIKEFPLVRQSQEVAPAWKERVLFQSKERGASHLPIMTYSQLEESIWREEHSARTAMTAADIAPDRSWKTTLDALHFNLDPDAQEPEKENRGEEGDVVAWSRRALSKLSVALEGGGRVVSPQRSPLSRRQLLALLAQPAGNVHTDFLLTPYDQAAIRAQLFRKHGPRGLERFKSSPDFQREVLNDYLARHRQDPGAALPDDLRALLASWVGNRPRGWEQIDALIQGLRSHARHDPEATVPPGQADPIRYFLMQSRRGPDYLFASSATVLLRHLGYPSRLVAGFYVRPGDHRLLTGTTPVTAGDLHYWTQVHAPNGLWINLEPTPGFEPTRPAYSFSERLTQTLDEARPYWPPVAAGVVLAVALILLRRRLAERLVTLWWRLRAGQPARRLVRATWRLIDRRARIAGRQRPPGTTLSAWSAAIEDRDPMLGASLATLAETANWITHAPPSALPQLGRDEGAIRTLCLRTVRGCTVRALRQTFSPVHQHPGGMDGNRDR